MSLKFDPNKAPPETEWGSYVPNRHPNFKMHKGLGQAKNAAQHRTNIIIYKWEDDRWVEKWRHEGEKKPTICEVCGKSTTKPFSYNSVTINKNRGKWKWSPGEPLERRWVHYDCGR